MVKILFLDLDGVLHPADCSDTDLADPCLFQHEEALAYALVDTDVQVVITSTWRHEHSPASMRILLPRLADRILGATRKLSYKTRYQEIEDWLRRKQLVHADWIALDDNPGMFPVNCASLVVCDSRIGLSTTELERVRAWACRLAAPKTQ